MPFVVIAPPGPVMTVVIYFDEIRRIFFGLPGLETFCNKSTVGDDELRTDCSLALRFDTTRGLGADV